MFFPGCPPYLTKYGWIFSICAHAFISFKYQHSQHVHLHATKPTLQTGNPVVLETQGYIETTILRILHTPPRPGSQNESNTVLRRACKSAGGKQSRIPFVYISFLPPFTKRNANSNYFCKAFVIHGGSPPILISHDACDRVGVFPP